MKIAKLNSERGDSYLGIWWWTGSEIIGTRVHPDDAYYDHGMLQAAETPDTNHLILWDSVKATASNPAEVEGKTYRSLERGRVIYDTRTMCFTVVCSPEACQDDHIKRAVLDFYRLSQNATKFEALSHYHVSNLNNNPALGQFSDNF